MRITCFYLSGRVSEPLSHTSISSTFGIANLTTDRMWFRAFPASVRAANKKLPPLPEICPAIHALAFGQLRLSESFMEGEDLKGPGEIVRFVKHWVSQSGKV